MAGEDLANEAATGPTTRFADQIIHGLTSGVIAVDEDGRIVTCNSAACEQLNISPEVLKEGEPFSAVAGLEPFRDIADQLRETGEPVSRREILIEQGVVRKEIGVSASLLDGPKTYNGVSFLFIDMTERRKLERAAEVNTRLASLGELAAGVVHELRNPLTIISGRAELLLRVVDEKDRVSVNDILNEARQLEGSIAHFLGFARPITFEPEACTATEIAERTLKLCQRKAKRKSVTMDATGHEGLLQMHVDAARMSEALANILTNAIDAVDKGGRVDMNVSQDGAFTVFEILDDGPGIHLEPDEDLFSPFFTKKRDGTGLGLSIVHRTVISQGGSATYGNHGGGGARFEIRIPTAQGARE